jgi:N-acetyl sugar amidotransferase
MRADRFLQLVARLEGLAPVDEWRSDELRIWPLVRAQLAARLDEVPAPPRTPSATYATMMRRVRHRLEAERNDRWRKARLRTDYDLAVLSDGVSKVHRKAGFEDRLCEPVIRTAELLGLRSILFDPGSPPLPRARASHLVQGELDLARFQARAHSLVAPRKLRTPGLRAILNDPVWGGADALQVLDLARVHRLSGETEAMARVFARALQKAGRPRLAFLVDYTLQSFAFTLACRRLGIPTVELQHGVQGAEHWAYAGWTRVPAGGYELLPDVYWVWSAAEAAVIDAWATRETGRRAFVGGNVDLTTWLRNRPESTKGATAGRCVLVTLQTGMTGPLQLAPIADAIALSPEDWRWTVRLHPTMSAAEASVARAQLEGEGVTFSDPRRESVFDALAKADGHVTHASSVISEAAMLGVPSVTLHPSAPRRFPVEHADGRAVSAETGSGVVATIERQGVTEFVPKGQQPASIIESMNTLLVELTAPPEDDTSRSVPRTCTRCVMDTSDPDISFDASGICSNCREHERRLAAMAQPSEERASQLARRTRSRSRTEYDCLIGLSGGVDSSYVALRAVDLGLRPLAIHVDNGWNSESAVHNIERLLETLDLDLVTHVIDWEEFRDLQLAYVRAGVVDIEALTDHAITAHGLRVAREKRIRVILTGNNVRTEGLMPRAWYHTKSDLTNVRDISRMHGGPPPRSLPMTGVLRHLSSRYLGQPRTVNLLDHIDYDKARAKAELQDRVGWRDYGGKHYESVFTRFYQAHILPEKFGIDKRRAHLSALVVTAQIDRNGALAKLDEPLYTQNELELDRSYVLKKWGLTGAEFEAWIRSTPRHHRVYLSADRYLGPLRQIIRSFRNSLR